MKDPAYSSLVLFRATFVTCFLPVICLNLLSFFVFVIFHWKQEDFLTNSLISKKIFVQAHELIGQNKVKICKILSQNLKIFWSKIGCPIYNLTYHISLNVF